MLFFFFNWKVVDSEGRLSGMRIFSAKHLFCLYQVVQLNKSDYCLYFLFTCLMKDARVETSSLRFSIRYTHLLQPLYVSASLLCVLC